MRKLCSTLCMKVIPAVVFGQRAELDRVVEDFSNLVDCAVKFGDKRSIRRRQVVDRGGVGVGKSGSDEAKPKYRADWLVCRERSGRS